MVGEPVAAQVSVYITDQKSNPSREMEAKAEEKGSEEKEAADKAKEINPVIRAMQEKEVGKVMIAFAVPITMAIVTSAGKSELAPWMMNLILIFLCVGFTLIIIGILQKDTLAEVVFGQYVELLGIAFIAAAFYGIVACFLPPEFAWVPLVCMLFFIATTLFALRLPSSTKKTT